MHTRHLLFLSILVTAFARADVPDVTSSLEYVSNPAMHRWPSDSYERGALDLQFHCGTLLVGGGEVENNQGPVLVYGTDPVTLDEKFEYSAGTEAIASCRVASWGELLVPSQDPRESDSNQAHVYIRGTNSVWRKYSNIGGSVPTASSGVVYNKTHIWDMEEFDGRVFTSGYQLHWSTNRCVKFVDTGSITNAYRRFDYMTADTHYYTSKLRRQMQLLRFSDRLYAVPNSYVQPNYSVSDSNQYFNKLELFTYNSSTKKFDESRIPLSYLFPNITSNDFRLVLSSAGTATWDPLPTGTYDTVLVRLWHTTPFKGRVLYVGCYDTLPAKPALTSYPLPLMGCSAYVQTKTSWGTTTKTLKADRLSFDNDKEEYPWDFTVVGDVCYALTSKPNANTKIVRHSVWKSTNGTSFTRVLSFDFHQNMISLDYRDGWFWFGVGVKNATRGYAYNNTADEAGAIYRVRLPQEPTSVEAVNPPAAIAEGGSASIAFRLTAQPASNLTLRVAARERRGVSLDKSSLTFTTSNWSTLQTVAVSLADDDVGDASKIFVQCGAFGNDIERGEFYSPQVTSALVTLDPVENDIPATVVSESCNPDVGKCTYRATFSSLGSLNGAAASSAAVSVKVYSDAALTALAGQTSGIVSVTGTEQSFTVNGLERGEWCWLVAETTTAPGVSHVFTSRFLSPIADPEDLVDLMDDESNREATYSNATTTGGATGTTAFDNKTTNFGGYKKPVEFFYLFKTPAVVKAFGVEGAGNSNPDQDPSTIKLFGGSSTNASDLALLFSRTGEPSWTAGEWRRWLVENETAYACYKVQVSGAHQHCYIREIELYGSADDKGRIVPTDPATFGSLSYDTATVGDSTVRIYHDLAYGTRGDAAGEGAEYTAHSWGYHNHRSGNYFDVYADDAILSSASARAKMPVFVFLHGGSWSQSYDKDGSSRDLLKRVAAAGYFVVTMDYQLQSDITELGETTPRENATFADMLADVDTMMTYLKTALPAIGLPTDKIVIGGESAGAHLAMCYAWDQSGTGLSGASLTHDLNVACVMSAVGPANLADEAMLGPILAAASIPDPAVQAYVAGFLTLMGWLTGTDIPAMVAGNDIAGAAATMSAWSPLGLVNGESCHAILAYGCTNATVSAYASDGVVPVSNYSSLTNALTAAAVSHDAQLFMLPAGMDHGNVSWNYEPSVAWIVEKLVAFKSANFDDPPPVVPMGRTNFAKYRQLTLARDLHTSSAIEGVPALVRLSEGDGFSYSDFTLPGGGDLMFADEDGNPLPHEVDKWNASGESLVWVKLPSTAAGTKIDMFWGRGGRSTAQSTALWDGYKGVWHMNSASPADASGSGNDGTAAGSAATAAGKIGDALSLQSTNSFVSCGTNLSNSALASGFTVGGWVNLDNRTGRHAIFGKNLFISLRTYGSGTIEVTTPGKKDHTLGVSVPAAGTWWHIALTFQKNTDNTGCKVYVNGAFAAQATSGDIANQADPTEMWLGRNQWGNDQNFKGFLDEMRLMASVRDANAVAAEYNAMNTDAADIFTFGDAVAIPAAGQLPTFRSAANGGAMAFSGAGAGRRLTFYLEGTLATAYYAVFTNGTLQGPFFAAANGVPGSTSGALELPVDAKEPSKFFAIGVSDEPIHEGDPLTL